MAMICKGTKIKKSIRNHSLPHQLAFFKAVFWPTVSDTSLTLFPVCAGRREIDLGFAVCFSVSHRVGNVGKLKSVCCNLA